MPTCSICSLAPASKALHEGLASHARVLCPWPWASACFLGRLLAAHKQAGLGQTIQQLQALLDPHSL